MTDQTGGDSGSGSDSESLAIEEKWLQAARNGKDEKVAQMIEQIKNGEIELDINLKGTEAVHI